MQVHSAACLPLTSEHDNLFFRVVAKRYENGVIIVISNLSCRVVDQAFGDPVLTAAMLDRLPGIGCSSSYTPYRRPEDSSVAGESTRKEYKRRLQGSVEPRSVPPCLQTYRRSDWGSPELRPRDACAGRHTKRSRRVAPGEICNVTALLLCRPALLLSASMRTAVMPNGISYS